ncbi:MAG TPA: beta-galactosidase [Anaerolineaceae bacterium]|nr:beta-galactosidase [Anaerolineaceae bacterium]
MKAPIQLTILVFALGLLTGCATASQSPNMGAISTGPALIATPSISEATSTGPAFAVTPSILPTNATAAPPTQSLTNQPRGLTAVNNFEPAKEGGGLFNGSAFENGTYTNPNIAGLTFRTSWEDIEPTQGNFVWAKLDKVFDNAENNSKWVELVLIPGFGTPAWALQGAQTATFSVIYGPGKGENRSLPLPWDQTYLDRWFTFLKAVSARYQNRPSFLKIAADGPTSVTAEMSLPNAPADLCTWVKLGYSSDRLIGAWKQVFANYAKIFPRQYFSLALYPSLPIVSTTRCENGNPVRVDHGESPRVTSIIVGLGADNYPEKFVLQENGMTAVKDNTAATGAYEVVKSYGGKVVIGYQLTTSAMLHPGDMGDVDGATALQKSLQRGLDANAQFLEVWEPDVLSPAAQNVLAATASALASAAQATSTIPANSTQSTSTATASFKTARGVFIVTGHNNAFRPATFINPAVDGIVIRTFWSNVQPAPDQFDWSFIDSQVQAASASGKKVILVVLPGAFTPQWALQGVQSEKFVVDYGFIQGTTVTLPLPWDATYLSRWFAFVRVLGQRYDSNPAIVNIPASGPTSISEEMSLPNDQAAIAKWKQLGYTLEKYEGAWQQTLAAFVQSFPTTQISLTFYPGLPIPDKSAETATRVELANFAFTNYGQHVAFQENGLSARKDTPALGYDLVQQYSTRTTVGFEMGTSATEKPDQMGGATAESALQASVNLGVKAGIKFLEIYEKDALNSALQSILAQTHSALTQ